MQVYSVGKSTLSFSASATKIAATHRRRCESNTREPKLPYIRLEGILRKNKGRNEYDETAKMEKYSQLAFFLLSLSLSCCLLYPG